MRLAYKYFGVMGLLTLSCGELFAANYPVPLSSLKEIRETSATVDQISIPDLAISSYPELKKFFKVNSIKMWSRDGRNVTDEKLRALANLKFTNLVNVSLLNGRRVTDVGINALTNFQSLRSLQLEGTSITDAGCEAIASGLSLSSVNVANCQAVTLKGIRVLGTSSVTSLTFSVENVSTDDVLRLLVSFTTVTRCQIVDKASKLDVGAIEKAALQRKIRVFVRRTGALQDMGLDRD